MAENQVRILHPEQKTAEKQPWERMKGEPAQYFMLFKRYLQLGRKRTLQALWDEEHPVQTSPESAEAEQAEKSVSLAAQHKTQPSGPWKKAAAAWHWKERAAEYDLWKREQAHQQLIAHIDHEAQYVTAAQRIAALDLCMATLMHVIEHEQNDLMLNEFGMFLRYFRMVTAVSHELRLEMASFEKGMR